MARYRERPPALGRRDPGITAIKDTDAGIAIITIGRHLDAIRTIRINPTGTTKPTTRGEPTSRGG
jgi:hypothetical protein